MVFELVKNSLRAVEERFMDLEKLAPPIRIIVADGLEDVTIKACLVSCLRVKTLYNTGQNMLYCVWHALDQDIQKAATFCPIQKDETRWENTRGIIVNC